MLYQLHYTVKGMYLNYKLYLYISSKRSFLSNNNLEFVIQLRYILFSFKWELSYFYIKIQTIDLMHSLWMKTLKLIKFLSNINDWNFAISGAITIIILFSTYEKLAFLFCLGTWQRIKGFYWVNYKLKIKIVSFFVVATMEN